MNISTFAIAYYMWVVFFLNLANIVVSHPQTTLGLQETDVDLVLPEETIPGTEQCQAAATGT